MAGTLAMYEICVEAYLLPRIGCLRLPELSPSHLNALYGELLERGGRAGRGLADKTVRNVHTIIHRALTDAVRWGLLARNVADDADPPRKRSREMRTRTREQLRTFLDHTRDDRLFAAFVLAATTGIRRGEVLGLRWSDMDLDAGRLAVRRSLVVVRSRLEFSDTKSGRGRQVALDPTSKAVLRLHRRHQAEERLAWGAAYRDDDLVICREDGSPLHPGRLVDAFERHAKGAGLPRIRFHDLRHTHATLALAAGVHPKVVSERLGHASIAITMDTYSHPIPTLDEEAARTVASLVFGEQEGA
jgi:integrase